MTGSDDPRPSLEGLHPSARGLDEMDTVEIVSLMQEGEHEALRAVGLALGSIARAADTAYECLRMGGLVHYAGAGTSGRLGVLDAVEIGPTFSSRSFRGHLAGGEGAMFHAVEGAEDDREAGQREGRTLSDKDMALGISASGRTPYVIGFLEGALGRGARCWLLTCGPLPGGLTLDGSIVLATGPEILAGSTRLKAGSATKAALNMLSTATMIRMGGTHDGWMIDVAPTNSKLRSRAEAILTEITGCTSKEASLALEASGMRPKVAALMIARGIDAMEAASRLDNAGGSLRAALNADTLKPHQEGNAYGQ